MYRFSAAGIYCSHAPYPGGVFNEHGEFLRKASISHWVLLCPLICMGTSGMNTIKQEGAEQKYLEAEQESINMSRAATLEKKKSLKS